MTLMDLCLAATSNIMKGVIPYTRDAKEYVAQTERHGQTKKAEERVSFMNVVRVENGNTHLYAGKGVGIKCIRISDTFRRKETFKELEGMGLQKVKFSCPSLCVDLYVQDLIQFFVSTIHLYRYTYFNFYFVRLKRGTCRISECLTKSGWLW